MPVHQFSKLRCVCFTVGLHLLLKILVRQGEVPHDFKILSFDETDLPCLVNIVSAVKS